MNTVIGYVRTNNQYKDIKEQRELITNYAKDNGLNVKLFEDVNVSGLVVGEQLLHAINKAAAGNFFVVSEVSRISRDRAIAQKVINTLNDKSVKIVYLD